MSAESKKVAVFAEVYSPNLGDAAIYDCVEELFGQYQVTTHSLDLSGRTKRPSESRGTEIASDGLRDLVRKPFQNIRILGRIHATFKWYVLDRKRLNRSWDKAISDSDAVVIGGGQLLTDRLFRFPLRIYEVARLAKLHNKPLAIFGCGADSKWGYFASKLYSKVLQQAVYVSARDQVSASALAGCVSTDVSVDVHADPVFATPRLLDDNSVIADRRKILGVNLQPVADFRRFAPAVNSISDTQYFGFWVRLLGDASSSGRELRLLTNGSPDDYATALRLQSLARSEGLTVELEPRPTSTHELVAQISKVSWIIGTRMHAGILAKSLGKSIVSIAWDPKVLEVWRQVGGLNYVLPAKILLHNDPWQFVEPVLMDQSKEMFDLTMSRVEIAAAAQKCIYALELQAS